MLAQAIPSVAIDNIMPRKLLFTVHTFAMVVAVVVDLQALAGVRRGLPREHVEPTQEALAEKHPPLSLEPQVQEQDEQTSLRRGHRQAPAFQIPPSAFPEVRALPLGKKFDAEP